MRSSPLLRRLLLLALLALIASLPVSALAQAPRPDFVGEAPESRPSFKAPAGREFVPDQLIVKYEPTASRAEEAAVRREEGLEEEKELELIDAEVVEVEGRSVERVIGELESHPDVEYAEPDFKVHATGLADEPRFSELWGLNNTGQPIRGTSGTPDVDVNALEASEVTRGDPNVTVAVIDTGVDFSHPDLEGRAWVNPGESGGKADNGIDDDNNGLVDDVNGWDFVGDDNDPDDDFGHGTHVAGTIAASVNGEGIAGVAPGVTLMNLKFLGADGSGTLSDAILAIQYAESKGIKISNNSWGCPPGECRSRALEEAIEASGSLFVAAAGNDANNNDVVPSFPNSFDSPNILSVAAIDNRGELADFSNFGARSVDLSAPGVDVLSSIPQIPPQSGVALSSVGTSGKALVAGFGAEGIGTAEGRASFVGRALSAIGHQNRPVVLVDDDKSQLGLPDARPTLVAAIRSATGSAPEVIVVREANGPALARLRGKTVVWATGFAFFSAFDQQGNITQPTLTARDRRTLESLLAGGGRLVLTGTNTLFGIEGSSFVVRTLGLNVRSEVLSERFEGAVGTAFEGESYEFNSALASPEFHDLLRPARSGVATQGDLIPSSHRYFSGTSMATPHAAGVAALVASVRPDLLDRPVALKSLLMSTTKPVRSTAGKTVTGGMVDAEAAVNAARRSP